MTQAAVSFTEDRIPLEGIEETIGELVELYGGTIDSEGDRSRMVTLPLRRGVASSGSIQCTLSWAPAATGAGGVTLTCDRDIDAPKAQRVLFLVAGIIGSLLFMMWPFFPAEKEWGTLAWLGGLVALAVYLMTLRKSSGGLAYDFLQRLAARQRSVNDPEGEAPLSGVRR